MAHGMKVFDSAGKLVLHSGAKMYTLDHIVERGYYDVHPTITVNSIDPPLVFGKTSHTTFSAHYENASDSICAPYRAALVKWISIDGAGVSTWEVDLKSHAYLWLSPAGLVFPESYFVDRTAASAVVRITEYIFTTSNADRKDGNGINVFSNSIDQGLVLSPESYPLMIKKRLLLDPNSEPLAHPGADSTKGRKILISEPGPKYGDPGVLSPPGSAIGDRADLDHDFAMMIGGLGQTTGSGASALFGYAYQGTVPSWSLQYANQLITQVGDPQPHAVVVRETTGQFGFYTHTCHISSQAGASGLTINNDGQHPGYRSCWLIDTYWYDKIWT